MPIDFAQIAVPFRMQPGLRRLAAGARHLHPLQEGSPLQAEKRAALRAGASRLVVPGFDAGPALASIAERARAEGSAARLDQGEPLELAFEEDLAILDGDGGTLPWLCVCLPSHWAPEDKLGLSLAAAHAPVADGKALREASRQLVALVTAGAEWERQVWSLSPSPRHDQHPRRQPRAAWPGTDDPEALAAQAYLRVERQTFFPVGRGTRQAVFTIGLQLQPLAQALDAPWKARRLHDALDSMNDEVAAYKGLERVRPGLLLWLRARAQAAPAAG